MNKTVNGRITKMISIFFITAVACGYSNDDNNVNYYNDDNINKKVIELLINYDKRRG